LADYFLYFLGYQLFILCTTVFYITSGIDTLTTNQIISGLISSSGGIFVSAYGYKLLGTIGAWIGLAIYYLLLIILTRKTFEHTRVKLYYPMLFIVLFIPGMVYTFGLF